jgi:hypothetical protein
VRSIDPNSRLKVKFPVRPEPVEGQALARGHGRGFDKLSPNGILFCAKTKFV